MKKKNKKEFLENLKYELYESAVQAPDQHFDIFKLMFADIRGKRAYRFREDFCGSFKIAAHWVEQDPRNTAVAIDLDPAPIDRGMRTHYQSLTGSQRERLEVLQQDVLKPMRVRKPFDIVSVCNFSFYVLKTRALLLKYFKNAHKVLGRDGIFILEMAGGPGMIEDVIECSTVKRKPYGKFTYHWDQKSFDPISHDALYSIHFKLKKPYKGIQKIKDAFVYDWRLWTIPEVRELLAEAGFKTSVVYCETSTRGKGSGCYQRTEVAENDYAWISYVVGLK